MSSRIARLVPGVHPRRTGTPDNLALCIARETWLSSLRRANYFGVNFLSTQSVISYLVVFSDVACHLIRRQFVRESRFNLFMSERGGQS